MRKEDFKEVTRETSPRMEWYFDEISERHPFICPVTGKKVWVEFIRKAGIGETPFKDVSYCSIFEGSPTCSKACIAFINHLRHFKK